MPRPLKWGILGASTIILSKDIDKYAFMCGSNFYETDVKGTKSCRRGYMHVYDRIVVKGLFLIPAIFSKNNNFKILNFRITS